MIHCKTSSWSVKIIPSEYMPETKATSIQLLSNVPLSRSLLELCRTQTLGFRHSDKGRLMSPQKWLGQKLNNETRLEIKYKQCNKPVSQLQYFL